MITLRTWFTTTLFAFSVSACSLIPEYQQPENPSPLPARQDASTDLNATDIGWRDFYQDATLQNLIDQSLSNNRNLQATALMVQQLREQYRIRRAEQLPMLDGEGGYTRQRFSPGANEFGQSGIFEQYSVGVGIAAWEIDFFGRLESLKQAALSDYLAQEATLKSTQLTLVAEVADAYLSWQASLAQLKLSESTREAREESYALITRRYEGGLSSELALRQAETALHEARIAVAQYQQQANQNFTLLELLVGQPLDQDDYPVNWQTTGLLRSLPDNLASDSLLQRPDVQAAELSIQANNASIGAARAAFFPRISLTSSLGLAADTPGGLLEGSNRTWQIAPQFNIPLLDWGVNEANLEIAELQKELSVVRYQEVIQVAFKEVYDELQARETLEDQLTAQQDLTEATARSLELAEKRFDAGVDSYLEVLDAQRSLIDAELAEIATNLARLRNQLTLYKALGGGLLAETISP
ncbi:RND efflux system, outer membrane lipoprotein CmeC [Methylophaga frappieri]|uniref:RND efflux system, outer membrane lipoprotein CmeC n=1 Tax=Methylophaga frappieri (strain ATCC BAA-2434 / DSM 25690 / JAM7) TaxID=754477 RepID=I1YJ87_METFJ|nr:efflux transporter outer membrane subunit [Methylophaga frappieri]AFJ02980.1 RND efflux system, outer membrane lipoprotein CmeC [Methylophaga frappieri]